jgi:thiol-disulfide isomerase/thioredoxin
MGQRTTPVKRSSEPLLSPRSSSSSAPTTTTTTRQHPTLPSNVFTVESLADYKVVVGDERERVVAVRFYAPWCRACRAVAPLYYKMAQSYPHVVFVDVPVTQENAKLHQGLGVPSLPYGHIYHPQGGLVEEVRISRKQIGEFHHKLQSYVLGRCDLKDYDNDNDGLSCYSSPYATTVLTGHDEEEDEEDELEESHA